MQCAHRLSGVARAPGSKVNALPILDQNPQRKPVSRAPCPLGCSSLFAFVGRITPFGNVAHDGGGSLPRLGEGHRRTGAQRHPPFVAVDSVLAQVGAAAAGGDANGKPTLGIIEHEPVLVAGLGRELFDFPLGELHDPSLRPGPQQVRGPLADPAG